MSAIPPTQESTFAAGELLTSPIGPWASKLFK